MEPIEGTSPTPFTWDESTWHWTWAQIAEAALWACEGKGQGSLKELYKLIESHPRTRGLDHWHERLRQTIQGSRRFVRIGDGYWALSEQFSPEQIAEFERLRRAEWPLLGPRPKTSG